MTPPETTTYEDQARKAFEDDAHYVATVVAMGECHEVVAGEDIFAADGVKLLDKGIALGAELRERLLRHKLMKPIDGSLTVSGGITAATLAAEAAQLAESHPHLRRLFPFPADRQRAAAALERLDLPAALAFKLTVARAQRRRLFDHLLTVTLICQFLAQQLQLADAAATDVLLAALLHDLGELHTDPALLEQGRRLDRNEMRYVYAHPITGYLIARNAAADHPEVATAVLQHQERLDGSGYPYGLRGDAVAVAARVVAVADVSASILARFGSSRRLSALMRLNHSKYDPGVLAPMQRAFAGADYEAIDDDDTVLPQLKAVAKLIRHWGDFRATLAGNRGSAPPPELAFLFERMVSLQAMLLQFGFDPSSLQQLRALVAEDSAIAAELAAALNEVRWQFADLEREIQRHKAQALRALTVDKSLALDDWLADLRHYLDETPAAP